MWTPFKICGIFVSLMCAVHGARILGIFHMPAYSHFQLGDRIFKELAARGHEVTVITPFELKTPVKNLKHVVLTGFVDEIKGLQSKMFEMDHQGILSKLIMFDIMGRQFTEYALNHTNVQKLLKSNEKFDLVINEMFMNDAFAGFAEYYKAPSVLIYPHGASQWTNSRMGNPHNPSYFPDFMLNYGRDMTFLQRTLNTLAYTVMELYMHLYTLPNQNQLLQKYFPGSRPLNEIYYNTSLMLLNSHVSTHNPLPHVPNMIEIGGYHVVPPKPLPKDLQDFLDGAKEGVIYFSMGSNLQSQNMPEQTRNEILSALGKLKQKVLWKWESETLPGQPPNVKLGKWFPQQDVLAHPNIKLFITHGGLLSTIEAIYHGVPVLGLPVYGDQELNMITAEQDGYGIGVPFRTVTEKTLNAALHEILTNPRYSTIAKQRSKIMQDRPTKPLDTAIYWIEYVLRHRGAPHLKTAALSLHWYQCLLLDVAAVIFLGVGAVLFLLYKIGKMLCGKKCKKVNRKEKQN